MPSRWKRNFLRHPLITWMKAALSTSFLICWWFYTLHCLHMSITGPKFYFAAFKVKNGAHNKYLSAPSAYLWYEGKKMMDGWSGKCKVCYSPKISTYIYFLMKVYVKGTANKSTSVLTHYWELLWIKIKKKQQLLLLETQQGGHHKTQKKWMQTCIQQTTKKIRKILIRS